MKRNPLSSKNDKPRCGWCTDDPLYIAYHDKEWGVPVHDDQTFFTLLNLEGMQAGLNWLTILRKRVAFDKAFYSFDPQKIVRLTEKNFDRLMQNPSIIRNKLKIRSIVNNARAYLKLIEAGDSFSDYLWQFVDGNPIKSHHKSLKTIPCESKESKAMSKDLKKRGFHFVGPTICYAFMQATGLLNDHLASCFRYNEI